MAARPGMVDIIQELRRLTDTSVDQTVVNGVSYWTDEQLQGVLDQHRKDVLDVMLTPYPMYEAGVFVTKRYYIPDYVGRFLENDPTTLQVVDQLGNVAESYTADLAGRQFNFESNTNEAAYFLRGRTFDLTETAAQIWLEKAGHRAALIEWKAGGQTLSEDQEYQHCLEMHRKFSGLRVRTTRLRHSGYHGQ